MYHPDTTPSHRGLWTTLFVLAFIAAAILSYHWYSSPLPNHFHAPIGIP